MTGIICPPPSYTSVDGPHCIYKYALNGYLVLLLAALVLEVDDTFLLGGGVFLAGTLASGLLDGLLPPSVPEIFQINYCLAFGSMPMITLKYARFFS